MSRRAASSSRFSQWLISLLLILLPGIGGAQQIFSDGLSHVISDELPDMVVHVYNLGSPSGYPTELTMTGGSRKGMRVYDSSKATLLAGDPGGVLLYDSANFTRLGGKAGVWAYGNSRALIAGGRGNASSGDSARITITDGHVDGVGSWGSSAVTIDGGTIGGLFGMGSGNITLTGATLTYTTEPGLTIYAVMSAEDSSNISIIGSGFKVDGVPVPYGVLSAQTGILTGTLASGDPVDDEFFQGGYLLWGGYFTGTIRLASSPCNDDADNDADGLIDYPDDPGCSGPQGASEQSACDDGIDNDADGTIDHAEDPGCTGPHDLSEGPDCDDGLDNGRDGFGDFPDDPGCFVAEAPSESPICDDALDNDGDGFCDLPTSTCSDGSTPGDPDCWIGWDASERPLSCGLGFELALLLPPLIWLRQGRRVPPKRPLTGGDLGG